MKRILFFVVALLTITSTSAFAQVKLTVLDQFLPAHASASAHGINKYGAVCGDISFSNSGARGYVLYADRNYQLLEPPVGYVSSSAIAISNNGTVVGSCSVSGGVGVPAKWDALGNISVLSDRAGYVKDINATGEMLVFLYNVYMGDPGGTFRVTSEGIWTKIEAGLTGGYTASGNAINDNGHVVGAIQYGNDSWPCRWDRQGRITVVSQEPNWVALGINNYQEVVGGGSSNYYSGAVFWAADLGAVRIGNLPGQWTSMARSLNGDGVIVGESGLGGSEKPCFWNKYSSEAQPLPNNGMTGGARRINGRGQAVGYLSSNGTRFAALWENVR